MCHQILFLQIINILDLKVNGLSMIDKGIFDGDIAVIKKTNTVF